MNEEDLHDIAMDKLQEQWSENQDIHLAQRQVSKGIRSSQISAVIALLIDLGIITKENLKR